MNEDKLEVYGTTDIPALCGEQKGMEPLMMNTIQLFFFQIQSFKQFFK